MVLVHLTFVECNPHNAPEPWGFPIELAPFTFFVLNKNKPEKLPIFPMSSGFVGCSEYLGHEGINTIRIYNGAEAFPTILNPSTQGTKTTRMSRGCRLSKK